ncbi:MAG: radical SAM protein, partial [Candidatus Eremiobacterota bacterium]
RRAPLSLDGLPLNDYFSPEIVLSTRTSTGCYWKKCTFCDTDFGVCADRRSLEDLADEMRDLRDRHGVEDYCFIDEAVVPASMERLGASLEQRGVQIHWYANARLETSFTPERLRNLRRTGLTMLMWGLESGSDRIMGLINKGIKLDRRLDILSHSNRAGVWNFCYIFFGFPSETEEEGMQTIRLLLDHREVIHSYGRSVFTLNKQARLQTDPARVGVLEMVADPEELSTTLHYVSATGNGPKQAAELSERCKLMCSVAYGEPLWMYLRFREVIHLYLKRHGREFLREFTFTPEQRERIHGLFSSRARPLTALLGVDNP